MMTFLPVRSDDATLARYAALFSACFPGTHKYTLGYLKWQYTENPDGPAIGFDAWDGEQLAAHYVCVPARAWVGDEKVRVLLSLNTATHPDYQGKGLFTKLAAMTYQAGAEQGYDAVYGVANANSTPGFIRKLDFQLVRPLEARIGIGSIANDTTANRPAAFERLWSADALAWRCACPNNPVRACQRDGMWRFDAAALPTARVYGEVRGASTSLPHRSAGGWAPLRLYLGLVPDHERDFGMYASIPQRLRPSPLNLIYRSLTGRVPQLDATNIRFTFLDFDAY